MSIKHLHPYTIISAIICIRHLHLYRY